MKQIILESDDFGITPAVSRKILELMRANQLSTTNCMPTMPDFNRSLDYINTRHELRMGIHLILDRHRPASKPQEIATLVDAEGSFLTFAEFARHVKSGQIDYQQVYFELVNQIKMAQRFGIVIDHLTTHHGFMNLSLEMFATVCKVAAKFELPIRNNLTTIDQKLAAKMKKTAEDMGLRMPEQHFMLSGNDQPIKHLMEAVDKMPDGQTIEVVSHAGVSTNLLSTRSSYTAIRETDAQVLASKKLAEEVEKRKGNLKVVDFMALR